MKKILKKLFIMICVLALPLSLASCDITEFFNSITGNTVNLEPGTYFVTTYEVNGEDYEPISNHDMIITTTTITFGNGQAAYYELDKNILTLSNQQGMSLSGGTIKYKNGTYTADLKTDEVIIHLVFSKKE